MALVAYYLPPSIFDMNCDCAFARIPETPRVRIATGMVSTVSVSAIAVMNSSTLVWATLTIPCCFFGSYLLCRNIGPQRAYPCSPKTLRSVFSIDFDMFFAKVSGLSERTSKTMYLLRSRKLGNKGLILVILRIILLVVFSLVMLRRAILFIKVVVLIILNI